MAFYLQLLIKDEVIESIEVDLTRYRTYEDRHGKIQVIKEWLKYKYALTICLIPNWSIELVTVSKANSIIKTIPNMTKKDIIDALAPYPDDIQVAIFDHKKNLADDWGDGSYTGIYIRFDVEKMEKEKWFEEGEAHDDDEPEAKDWIALSFSNEDYEDAKGNQGEEDDESFPGLTFPSFTGPSCRVCGCTDDDCRQCIEKTGKPCHWVEKDLCSACKDNGCR
jgi:hypothetical protein